RDNRTNGGVHGRIRKGVTEKEKARSRESPPSVFDKGEACDKRSGRKMQQVLSRRSEGSISRKRSSLSEGKELLATATAPPVCHGWESCERAAARRVGVCGL